MTTSIPVDSQSASAREDAFMCLRPVGSGTRRRLPVPGQGSGAIRSALTLGALATVMAAFTLTPTGVLGATPAVQAHAPSAKGVSLRLADVVRVLGGGLSAGIAHSSKPQAMGACTSTPPVTEFVSNFLAPMGRRGVLAVIDDVYTYRSASGPRCNLKLKISMNNLVAVGKLTIVHGVGDSAYILDTTGPKSKAPPVYTLGLNFIRGPYRAVIIVQSNKPIKQSDMLRLGTIVDGRMKKRA